MSQADGFDEKYVQGKAECLIDVLSGILMEISKSPFNIRPERVLSTLKEYRPYVPSEQYSPYEDGYFWSKYKLKDVLREKRSRETP